jgi:DNA excision repair protein ERCC-8
MFVTSGTDGALKLWDANTMTPALEFEDFCGDVIYQHAMSEIAGHGLIAVGGQARKVKLCDPASGASTHELVGHRDAILSVAWSPTDEYTLATASRDNTVMLWDVRAAGPIQVLDQHNGERHGFSSTVVTTHTGECNGVSFTPDGRHIVTTGTDSR